MHSQQAPGQLSAIPLLWDNGTGSCAFIEIGTAPSYPEGRLQSTEASQAESSSASLWHTLPRLCLCFYLLSTSSSVALSVSLSQGVTFSSGRTSWYISVPGGAFPTPFQHIPLISNFFFCSHTCFSTPSPPLSALFCPTLHFLGPQGTDRWSLFCSTQLLLLVRLGSVKQLTGLSSDDLKKNVQLYSD